MIVKMNVSEYRGVPEWKHYDLNSGNLTAHPSGKLHVNGEETGEDVFSAECLLCDIESCLEYQVAVQIREAVGAEVVTDDEI